MAEHTGGDADGLQVAHHFENADQQYQSAKLGMWIFLATEVLFFGGLFCAYAVYRSNHPEIFVFGHHFLDKNLGALNTVILICSSLTAAWAVRAAQLKDIRMLKLMLLLTMIFAFGFLGVKAVEYEAKWKHGLLWARQYNPHVEHGKGSESSAGEQTSSEGLTESKAGAVENNVAGDELMTESGEQTAEPGTSTESVVSPKLRSAIAPASVGPLGLAQPDAEETDAHFIEAEPANAQLFFSIYFLMTGLHGIHVLGGIGAFIWLLYGARRGDYDTGHFTRVDMVALYWHVVDLIWIYLFLLLYLID